MPQRVHITASSAISNGQCFKNGQSVFIGQANDLPAFLHAFYQQLGLKYPKFFKMDHLSKLGFLAAELLLKDNFNKASYQPEEIGIVLSNASSSLDTDIRYYDSVKDIASPALFVYTLPNIIIGEISIKHNFKGENAFFIFEDFNAAFLENYVSSLLNTDVLRACICGWVEVIAGAYKTVLFLVEKESGDEKSDLALEFTKENLNKIYHFTNG